MKKFLNEFYIVQKKDTIDSIAKKYDVNAMIILITNNITPKMLKEGMLLYIKNKK